jgi:hypothetical protein
MKIRFLPNLAILLIIIFTGCKKDFTVEKIDSNIEIKMWETLDSTKRKLQFYCSTEKAYECSNYAISKTYRKSPGTIEIGFRGVIKYDLCFTAFGPASTIIDLGTLPNGIYNLNINVEGNKSKGKLTVTQGYYAIELDNPKQLDIITTALYRIPANTIWGSVRYHESSTAALVKTFIDSLQVLNAIPYEYKPGDYGYFEIGPDGEILPHQNHGARFIRPFIYNYTGTTTNLEKLVKNFGARYGNSLSVILYNTRGETYRSWTP